MSTGNKIAPKGQVWVCTACGKRSQDLYGFQPINRGWDVSCTLNAVLCFTDKILLNRFDRVDRIMENGIVLNEESTPKTDEKENKS